MSLRCCGCVLVGPKAQALREPSGRTSRAALVLGALLSSLLGYSQNVQAQDPLNQIASPAFTTALPVELGFLNVSNGNLHQQVTLGVFPQRGAQPLVAALAYDSRIWQIFGTTWQPTNGSSPTGGWRFLTSVDPGTIGAGGSAISCGQAPHRMLGGGRTYEYVWTQPDGLRRTFPINLVTVRTGNPCGLQAITSGSSFATDASGIQLVVTNGAVAIFDTAGSQVYPYFKDANGNFFGRSGANVVDTLGRTPISVTTSCNSNASQTCYDVLNSKGTTSRYTVTTQSISVNTAFGVSGVTEFSGTITVIQSILLPDGNSYTFSYDSGTAPGHYGLLTGLTLPSGGQVSYGYSAFKDSLGNVNQWVTSRTSGGGNWTYTPTVTVSCASGGSTCTQTVAVTSPSADESDYGFTLNSGSWASSVQFFSGSHASGKLLSAESNSWDFSQPCSPAPCTGASNIRKLQTMTTLGANGDSNIVSNQSVIGYSGPNTSNVASTKEWKLVAGVSFPSTPDRETDFTYLATPAYTSKNITSRVLTQTVKDGSGSVLAQTNFSYDDPGSLVASSPATGIVSHDDTNFGLSDMARGNLTKIQSCTVLPSCSSSLATTLVYDTAGHAVESYDSAGNTTSYGYADNFFNDASPIVNPPQSFTPTSPTAAYLTTVTPPLTGTITRGYYFGTGKAASSKDSNGADSYSHFLDSLDRLTHSYAPVAPNGNRPWTLAVYSTSDLEVDTYASITDAVPAASCSSCTHTQALTDALGRVTTQTLVNDPEGATNLATNYDTTGRLMNVSHPYRNTNDATYGLETPSYDGLSRILKTTHQDNSKIQTYYGSAVSGAGLGGITAQLCSATTYGVGFPALSIDEAGKKRESWTGGFGALIELDEPDSSGNLTSATCYHYDVLGNLTQTVHGSQTRSVSYDALSRVTSVTAPETGSTGSHTSTFSYLTAASGLCSGNSAAPCSATDPRGIVKTITYDALSRVISIGYSDATPTVRYAYDGIAPTGCSTAPPALTMTNPKGRRTAMCDGSGATSWSYDAAGHITTEKRTIAGITRSISYAYNLDGSVATITYPSLRQVAYTVSNAERLTSAVDVASGTKYAISASYAPPGGLQSLISGQISGGFGGLTQTHSYNSRGEDTATQASSSNGTAQNLTFAYALPGGNNGSFSSITNNSDNGRSENFVYDPLSRLTSATTQASSGTDCWGQSFTVDPLANLTNIGVAQCTAGALSTSANANNQLTNLTYDLAGNTTGDGSFTYTYDAENRVSSVAGVTYTYDGDGLRVKKSNGTLYWRSVSGDAIAETDLSGNTISEYVFMAGRRVARLDASSGVFYYFPDPLGTVRTITDAQGHLCYDAEFTPYGQELSHTNTCPQNYKFTGYERDAETGNDYAFARYYNPRLGRFMTPDPLFGDLGNPQSLNRYAYVGNDPTNLVDPSGLCGEGRGDGRGCKVAGASGKCILDGFEIDCNLLYGFLGLAAGDQFGLLQLAYTQVAWFVWYGHDQMLYAPAYGSSFGLLSLLGAASDSGNSSAPSNCPAGPANVYSFIQANQAAANALSKQSGVNADYLLGLSGWESQWGGNRFALQGNNFFSLHGGSSAPFANGSMKAGGANVYLSTFPSYFASGQSFLAQYGNGLAGASSPAAFAQQLINNHFNSGNAATGGNSNFLSNTVTGINMVVRRKGC